MEKSYKMQQKLLPPWQQCVKQCTDLWLWHQLELQIEAAVPQCPRYPNEKQCAEVFVAPEKEKYMYL